MLTETPASKVNALRRCFEGGETRPIAWRQKQLAALESMLRDNEAAIFEAMATDLSKSQTETYATEIGLLYSEIRHARRHLKSWMKAQRVSTGLHNLPGKAWTKPEPLGVVLIIAPWNYPLMLALSPLIGALAAGNCALIKPSEMTPSVSRLLAEMVARSFSRSVVQVVEGGVEETTQLLRERFDHIFFTGSEAVGRIVMRAASEHLTPITLELGGKCPCILTSSADIKVAARRIAWGKTLNAGQTCVAPDYLIALPGTSEVFKREFTRQIKSFFGEDSQNSKSYPRIVNDQHFDRLARMLSEESISYGGQSDREDRFIAPTLLENLPVDAPALTDEIFGPILPVIEVADLKEAIDHINARPKPLSLYLFSNDTDEQRRVAEATRSGTMLINDVVMQFGTTTVPFGGVGSSGMGQSHGKASFDAFSHHKSIMRKPFWGEVKLRYAPYTKRQERLIRLLFGR
ncbi:aldehyde dehydrogenase family protein [Cognatishimia activa]|uniref:aldehyde dehydrogenase family protein n=1 Tax=Cognatishimia activa TaxID=1715691 RepID=UPI002231C981|nr:aldehyde dehydrogenase family protein [Cognatishimia activa]UZD89619.1 aldehyde dehydrogenase family protein [Cognatishimia activa]